MTKYSEECKKTWIETDTIAIYSAIDLAISAQIISMNEFAYTVCPVCPYMCDSCKFCWNIYIKSRYENEGQRYKNIMEILIESFYKENRVDTFHFFRTNICKACGNECKQVSLGTHCTEKYLNQVKGDIPMCYSRSTYLTRYLTPKKTIFPQVSVDGDTMLEIIDRLWKDDKTNSKKRTYCPED